MNKILEKAERIFAIVEACEKYETFNDQLNLYPLSTVPQLQLNCENVSINFIQDTGQNVAEVSSRTFSVRCKLLLTSSFFATFFLDYGNTSTITQTYKKN